MSQPDFASAALRHLRDAEHLRGGSGHASRDQAWHLAGYAHECARKACIATSWVPKLLGHDFSEASEVTIELAIALDPRAGRFPVRGWASEYPAIGAWRPDHRYEATGTADEASNRDVDALVTKGRHAVDTCIVALFLDGALHVGSVR